MNIISFYKIDSNGLPSKRYGHSLVANILGACLFGGSDENGKVLSDIYFYNYATESWTAIEEKGEQIPSIRNFHSSVLYKNSMFIFGGKSNYDYFNDLFEFNFETFEWKEIKNNNNNISSTIDKKNENIPSPRYGHSCVIWQDKMFLYGGYDNLGIICGDFWEFDLIQFQWKKLLSPLKNFNELDNSQLGLLSRYHHSSIIEKNKMIIFGGLTDLGVTNTILQYNFEKEKWNFIEGKGKIIPKPRMGQAIFCYQDHFVISGGYDKNNNFFFGDLFLFDSVNQNWICIFDGNFNSKNQKKSNNNNNSFFFSSRYFHSICNFNDQIFVFGGISNNNSNKANDSIVLNDFHYGLDCFKIQFNNSFLVDLPFDILNEIVSYLNKIEEILNLSFTCKKLFQVCSSNKIWLPLYLSIFKSSSWRENHLKIENIKNEFFKLNNSFLIHPNNTKEWTKVNFLDKKTTSLISINSIVVGDNFVGKTILLMYYVQNFFTAPEYIPSFFEDYNANVMWNGKPFNFGLSEQKKKDEKSRILTYKQKDVFLISFSVVDRKSFENIYKIWVPEITKICPNTPFILVGTKIDLRKNEEFLKKLKETPISIEEGIQMAREIKAIGYVENSSLTQEGVKLTFEAVIFASCYSKGFLDLKDFQTKNLKNKKKDCLLQ